MEKPTSRITVKLSRSFSRLESRSTIRALIALSNICQEEAENGSLHDTLKTWNFHRRIALSDRQARRREMSKHRRIHIASRGVGRSRNHSDVHELFESIISQCIYESGEDISFHVEGMNAIDESKVEMKEILLSSSTVTVVRAEYEKRAVVVKTLKDPIFLGIELAVYSRLQQSSKNICPEVIGYLPDAIVLEQVGDDIRNVNGSSLVENRSINKETLEKLGIEAIYLYGLKEIHALGFLHGDIALRNIRIISLSEVWIDFGNCQPGSVGRMNTEIKETKILFGLEST